MVGKELFTPPLSERICKALPVLFNVVEMENMRGGKLGMEVGTMRERVIIALFMYVFGKEKVTIPEKTSSEVDVAVAGTEFSIKTKSGTGYAGVKLTWTTDWEKVDAFAQSFTPQCHMLFININWGGRGGFFLIPCAVQQKVLKQLGQDDFFKIPPRGTNPRGVELSQVAMRMLQEHEDTKVLSIDWARTPTEESQQFIENLQYDRWIEMWESVK